MIIRSPFSILDLRRLIDNFSLFYFKFMADGGSRHLGAWMSKVTSQERCIWNGLSFELVCLEHIGQVKRALGISGIQTEEHAWRRKGDGEREGAQIDLLIERADRAVNICEMKYSTAEYEISGTEGENLRRQRQAFVEDEDFKGSVFLTLVTPHGVVRNAQWNDIQSEVTLDDLFKEEPRLCAKERAMTKNFEKSFVSRLPAPVAEDGDGTVSTNKIKGLYHFLPFTFYF